MNAMPQNIHPYEPLCRLVPMGAFSKLWTTLFHDRNLKCRGRHLLFTPSLLAMPLRVTTGVTRPGDQKKGRVKVTSTRRRSRLWVLRYEIFGRHEFTGSWNVKNQPWTKWTVSMSRRKLPRCRKIAVNFDFTISANYGYVYDFENVKRIIWSHELQTTTKFALLKAPKYFGQS